MFSVAELLERPLTAKQRFTLEAVARGDFERYSRRVGWQVFEAVRTKSDRTPISGQLRALRRRGLIRGSLGSGNYSLTVAGAFELYFDASHLLFRHAFVTAQPSYM